MAKLSQYMDGYEAGLDRALRIVREQGVQGLEDEIKFRNITGIHTNMPKQDVNNLVQEVKDKVVTAYTILAMASLHDNFQFGYTRCRRWWEGVELGAEYLCKDLATWDDYIRGIKEEIGLDMGIRYK